MTMILALGPHRFQITPMSLKELDRYESYRQPSQMLLGTAPETHFMGPGDVTITIPGSVFPKAFGGRDEVEAMRATGRSGITVPVVAGTGRVYGMFVITGVKIKERHHGPDGEPAQIDFTVTLKRDGGGSSIFARIFG